MDESSESHISWKLCLETIDNRLFSGILRELAENGRSTDVDRVINSFVRSKFGIDPNVDTYNEILLGYVARGTCSKQIKSCKI